MKWIKAIFILCLCIVTLEFLAQFRFQQNNIWLPMKLRKNIAENSLASHRLNKNFSGKSSTGIPFYTNSFGFRCSLNDFQNKSHNSDKNIVLLAGDSICFGMYEPFKNSIGYYLNKNISKYNWNCMTQAIPGGSQAMTTDHLFGPDHLAKQTKAKWIIHSITHYDAVDNLLYNQDKEKLKNSSDRILRLLKISLTPYFAQMLQVKVRDFLLKDDPTDLLFADSLNRNNASTKTIKALFDACKKENISLAFFFTPDRGELLNPSFEKQKELEAFFNKNHIPYFDLRLALKNDQSIDLNKVFRDDKIHLSQYGAMKSAEKLSNWFHKIQQ